jgi:tetratricopeptide (TPR) repeat protein
VRSANWLPAFILGLIALGSSLPGRAQSDALYSLTNAAPLPATPESSVTLGPAPSSLSGNSPSIAPPTNEAQIAALQQQALDLCNQKKFDEALQPLNQILRDNPKNIQALTLRGFAHAQKKAWALAQADFQSILQIDSNQYLARFNLSELQFQQKFYDQARPGFDALRGNPDLGDLSAYKVFLCDLYAGHKAAAQSELDVFNNVGGDPSYYFANAAWELYYHRPESARPWLASALRIYYPAKVQNYASSLVDLGYLPLPPPPGGSASP